MGNSAALDLRQGKTGAARSDPYIAGERQLEAFIDRIAVDQRDRWLGDRCYRFDRATVHALDKAAAESRALAGNRQNRDGIVVLDALGKSGQLAGDRSGNPAVAFGRSDDGGQASVGEFNLEAAGLRACVPHQAPSRSFWRRILPSALRGSSATNSTISGRLKLANRRRQNSITSVASIDAPLRATTTALIVSPHSTDGTPITAASSIDGWLIRTVSISAGAIFSPPRMIRSSL